jgi:crescentin
MFNKLMTSMGGSKGSAPPAAGSPIAFSGAAFAAAPAAFAPQPAQAEPQAAAPAPQPETGDRLRALGTYHEELRGRCESAVGSLSSLRGIADDIDGIFSEFGTIAAEIHTLRRELSESQGLLINEHRTAEDLRGKLANLQSQHMRAQAELDETTAERDLLKRARAELGEAHQVAMVTLKENEAQIKVLTLDLAAMRGENEDFSSRMETLTLAQSDAEKQIHELREEKRMLQANLDFESAEKNRFSKLHEEMVSAMGDQRRAFTTATDEMERGRERLLQLESRQNELLRERESLTAAVDTSKALRETEARNYEAKIEAISSRARLAEHMLEKTRDEQRSAFRDQAAHTDALRQVRRLEGEGETLRLDLADRDRRLKELESNEAQLRAKFEDTNLKLRDRNRFAEQTVEKIKGLQDALEAAQTRHTAYAEQIEDQIRKFTEQADRDRADRTYLEGALNSARRDRAHLQSLIIRMKGGETAELSADEFGFDAAPPRAAAMASRVAELRPLPLRGGSHQPDA